MVDCSPYTIEIIWRLVALRARRLTPLLAEQDGLKMVSLQEIESAKLRMLQARKALEDYEGLKGAASSPEHRALTRVFAKAAETYLELSANQR